MKPFSTIAAILLFLMAAVHVLRLFTGFEVVISGHPIPLWLNGLGALIGLVVSVGLWRESRSNP